MPVVAGFEIEAGAAPPGLPAGTAGLKPAASPAPSSTEDGATNFRASWQSVLASYGDDADAAQASRTQLTGAQPGSAAALANPPNSSPPTAAHAPAADAQPTPAIQQSAAAAARLRAQHDAASARTEDVEAAATADPHSVDGHAARTAAKSTRDPNAPAKPAGSQTAAGAAPQQLVVMTGLVPFAPAQPASHAGDAAQTAHASHASAGSERSGPLYGNGIAPSPAPSAGSAADAVLSGKAEPSAIADHRSDAHASEAQRIPSQDANAADAASQVAGPNPAGDNGPDGPDVQPDGSGVAFSSSAGEQLAAAGVQRPGDPLSAKSLHTTVGAASSSSAAADAAVQPPGHLLAAQSPGSMAEPGAGGHGAATAARGPDFGSPNAPSPPRETFAALDADSAHGTGWIHAGSRSAEAGFEDPSLGWVGVRADLSAAGVHAAVVPGSQAAAQALGSHMAGLNTYLSEHRSGVDSLTLASPEGRGSDTGAQPGAQGNAQNAADQHSANDGGQGQRTTEDAAFGRETSSRLTQSDSVTDSAPPIRPAGATISVIA